jgi:endonuclease YncB( thermonuclease family)
MDVQIEMLRSLGCAASLFLALSLSASADDLVGRPSRVDGDTLEIHGTRIRLWGIDAPESAQLCRGEDSLQHRCGAEAANDLDAFIARRPDSVYTNGSLCGGRNFTSWTRCIDMRTVRKNVRR